MRIGFVICMLCFGSAWGQEAKSENTLPGRAPAVKAPAIADAFVPTLTLEASGTPAASPEPLSAVLAPVLCDDDQNLYFRRVGVNPAISPVVRIADDGRSSATFDASTLPGVTRELDVWSFTVDRFGRVYQLVRMEESKNTYATYLVAFSKSGEVTGKTKIYSEFIPSTLVALPSGEFFMSGVNRKKSRDDVPGSITGIFDSDGRLRRNLTPAIDGTTPPRDLTTKTQIPAQVANEAIEKGDARLGPDENIYVFQATTPVRVIVLTQTGDVLRKLVLTPPFRDAEPFEYRVSANRILVGYRTAAKASSALAKESPQALYAVFNAENGEPLLNYRFGESIRGALGCFSPERFSYLTGSRDGHLAILHASAK